MGFYWQLIAIFLLAMVNAQQMAFEDVGGLAESDGSCAGLISRFSDRELKSHVEGRGDFEWMYIQQGHSCLQKLMAANYFETATFLLYSLDASPQLNRKVYSQVKSGALIGIEEVKQGQGDLSSFLDKLQTSHLLAKKAPTPKPDEIANTTNIPIISPAFRWAQSLDTAFLEIKFATRLDSPSCLDLIEKHVSITETKVSVEAVCRNDKNLLRYVLVINLYGRVALVDLDAKENEAAFAAYELGKSEHQKRIEDYQKQIGILRAAGNQTKVDVSDEDEDFDDGGHTHSSQQIEAPTSEKKQKFNVKFDERYYTLPSKEGGDAAGYSEIERQLPMPIDVQKFEKLYRPADTALRSTVEWQSAGRLKLQLAKLGAPDRWYRLNSDYRTKTFQNSQMWWDLHLKYRTQLVKHARLPEDDEDYEDVLDELRVADEERAERRVARRERERQGEEYLAFLKRQKDEVIEMGKAAEAKRRKEAGLPPLEEVKEDPQEVEARQAAANVKLQELHAKLEGQQGKDQAEKARKLKKKSKK